MITAIKDEIFLCSLKTMYVLEKNFSVFSTALINGSRRSKVFQNTAVLNISKKSTKSHLWENLFKQIFRQKFRSITSKIFTKYEIVFCSIFHSQASYNFANGFLISLYVCTHQMRKQFPRGVPKRSCSQKFCKIQRKTPVPDLFLIKLQASGVCFQHNESIS